MNRNRDLVGHGCRRHEQGAFGPQQLGHPFKKFGRGRVLTLLLVADRRIESRFPHLAGRYRPFGVEIGNTRRQWAGFLSSVRAYHCLFSFFEVALLPILRPPKFLGQSAHT